MGSLNNKSEVVSDVAAATAAEVVVTYTANALTGATTQTVADGNVPTVAELGQFCENLRTQQALVQADIAALRTAQNL
jgi:L-asparaginase/Glu-tRNA(Gln) amidotransferase subunit D